IKVKRVFREANDTAYRSAKLALQMTNELVWLEETPKPIESIVTRGISILY
ncbi:hypothetical protein PanWU01x14_269180, partial [Parasponia andersonii]